METLFCNHCQKEVGFYTELKANNNVARCNDCNGFIKNIPYQEPQLYVGKYKNKPIKDIEDMGYLKWALREMKLSNNVRQAIESRIKQFEFLAK